MAAVVLFDAIPTCWVCNISQRQNNFVDFLLQRRLVLKIRQTNFYTITASEYRRCNDHSDLLTEHFGILQRCAATVSEHRCCNGISPTLLCLLTQPVGIASKSTTVAKYYSCSSRDGVPWGMVNNTCRQYRFSLRFD